jgi:hypothetical protein
MRSDTEKQKAKKVAVHPHPALTMTKIVAKKLITHNQKTLTATDICGDATLSLSNIRDCTSLPVSNKHLSKKEN